MQKKYDPKSHGMELLWLSAAALYLELLVIRWMSVDIRAFSVFKTFPLVTFFIGLGVGFAMGSDKRFANFPLALLAFVASIKLADMLKLGLFMFPSSQQFNWLTYTESLFWLYVPLLMVLLVVLLSGPFAMAVCLGSRLGVLFNQMAPLSAYCLNVGGSIAGGVVFAVLCFLGLSPWVLILLPCALVVFLSPSPPGWRLRAGALTIVAALLACWSVSSETGVATYWSPYQRLDLVPVRYQLVPKRSSDLGQPRPEITGFVLRANKLIYQEAYDAKPDKFKEWQGPMDFESQQRRCALPYQLRRVKDVLVVGSGMGSDVAHALQSGASSIDAVDIDPVIIKLGREHHPLKPYDSPIVHVVCDDARHYFNSCSKLYDLIIFAHLDSHTVTGVSSSVRLDNYVYTRESIARAVQRLKPDGLLVLAFYTARKWFTDRLFVTIEQAVGYPPLVLKDVQVQENTFFVVGDSIRTGTFMLPPVLHRLYEQWKPASTGTRPLSDDWPYLYLASTAFDPLYALVVLQILLIAACAGRRVLFAPAPGNHWQLFFMGAAFMLLELQLISRLSLLYGATWLTSAIVINGILIMILGANFLVMQWKAAFQTRQKQLYVILLISLIISYLFPASEAISWNVKGLELGYVVVTLVTLLPVLFASLIFAIVFTGTQDPSKALAFNLFGAVAGAMLEYLSNYVGINNLLLVVLGLYFLSSLFLWPKGIISGRLKRNPDLLSGQ